MPDESATGSAAESTATVTEPTKDQAEWLKYQAKIEVVREVLARRGAIPEQEAKQLAECVNTAFDSITYE